MPLPLPSHLAEVWPWGLPSAHPSSTLPCRWEPQLPILPRADLQQHLLARPPPSGELPGGCADEGPRGRGAWERQEGTCRRQHILQGAAEAR